MKKLTALLILTSLLTPLLTSCHYFFTFNTDDPLRVPIPFTTPEDTADISMTTKAQTDEAVRTDIPENDSPYAALIKFCSDFLLTEAKSSDGKQNTLTSPLSAYLALSMVKEGADGTTLDEMSAVMGDISGEDMRTLIEDLTSLNDTTLNIADSVWVDSQFAPKQSYLDLLKNHYLAEGFNLKLASAEKKVNTWIEENTNGLIKNMLSDTALDKAVMALVNTIYMKAKWQNEFNKNATHERIFTGSDGVGKTVDFMYKTASYRVIETDEFIGVVLPYSDGSLEFAALMPKNASKPASDIFTHVSEIGGWAAAAESAQSERIKLYIPKFEQEATGSLVSTLKKMGIVTAFDKLSASFEGIAENIYVQEVLQNAVLKLDESGTEAAAATVVYAAATSAAPPQAEPRTIEFNRPFAFAVYDKVSGAVLFAGEHNMP